MKTFNSILVLVTKTALISALLVSFTKCKHGLPENDSATLASQNQSPPSGVICDTNAVQNLGNGQVACFNYELTAKKIHSFRVEKASCPNDSIMLKNFEQSDDIFTYFCAKQSDYQIKNVRACTEDAETVFKKVSSTYLVSCSCDNEVIFDTNSQENVSRQNERSDQIIAAMEITDKKRIDIESYQHAICVQSSSYSTSPPIEGFANRRGNLFLENEQYRVNDEEKSYLETAESTNVAERKQAIVKFYESRIERGDKYCKLAIGVVKNSSLLGRAANHWLKYQVKVVNSHREQEILKGKSWFEFNEMVNLNIAKRHALAVTNDNFGRLGILSSGQISEYHESYFRELGLSARTFGGSSLGFRTSYWCRGCDARP